jgi:galactose oxidase
MSGACALYDIDKFFTVGGAEQYDIYQTPGSNRAYTVDFSTNTPVVTRQPNMRFPRTLVTTVVLPDGNIVVLGGLTAVALFSDENAVFHIEMFNPYTRTWSDFVSTLTTPRPYHGVSLLLKDARVLVGGGGLCGAGCDYTTSWNHPNVEIITPPYLVNASGLPITNRPSIVSGPATFLPNGQIVVTMNASGPHTFALMRLGTSTHTVNLDQRRVPLQVLSQSGTQFTLKVPQNPVHVPPGLYWLFAMNSAGVPSTGWDLRRG